jgi:hypothetical protein
VLTSFRVCKGSSRLSRALVLLLHALGVPADLFLRLCAEEVGRPSWTTYPCWHRG